MAARRQIETERRERKRPDWARKFAWSQFDRSTSINDDVDSSGACCLHCEADVGGDRILRLFGHSLHAEKPNETIHISFVYMAKTKIGEQYVLIVKEDLLRYSRRLRGTWLMPENGRRPSLLDGSPKRVSALGRGPRDAFEERAHAHAAQQAECRAPFHIAVLVVIKGICEVGKALNSYGPAKRFIRSCSYSYRLTFGSWYSH